MSPSLLRKAAFSALTTVLGLAVLEGVLRFTTHEAAQVSIDNDLVLAHVKDGQMKFDPYLGWVRLHVPDPTHDVDTNGFRHAEVRKAKAEGAWRAFALGDSQTWGAGVESWETWPSVTERALSKTHPNQRIEVVNAGISGYSSLQAYRLILSKLLDFQPDALLIDCRTWDSHRETGLPPSRESTFVSRLIFHSRIAYVIRWATSRLRHDEGRPMYTESLDWKLEVQKGIYGNHDLIADLGRERGIAVVFLDYPVLDDTRHVIASLAPKNELPPGSIVAPVTAALETSGLSGADLFLDKNHASVRGNDIIGEAVARTITEAGILP